MWFRYYLSDFEMVPAADISIITPVITFMQGICNYIPETNHVSGAYSVAAVLHLQLVLHSMLFRP